MKKSNYVVNAKEKKIVVNVAELTEKELVAVRNYMALGFELVQKEKPSKTVEGMRAELEADKATLEAFNNAYKEKPKKGNKDFKETGFAKACKIYNEWVKAKKQEESK